MWVGSHLRWLQIRLRPWLRKRQQICHSSGGSSIGSCGIGCCGGGGSVGAAGAGCTLTVRAVECGLVGAGGVLRLCPCGSRYTLTAWALPSRLALRARGSGLAITACTTRLRLGRRPCGLALPTHNNQTAKQQPQKLRWQRCRLSAAVVAAGGSSGGSSIGSSGGIGCGSGKQRQRQRQRRQ